MARLPDGDFFHLARYDEVPGESEPFLVASEAGTLCVGFFSRQALAEEHRQALPEDGWKCSRVSRSDVLSWLECMYETGIANAVLDPPVGYRGSGEPIFGILVESE